MKSCGCLSLSWIKHWMRFTRQYSIWKWIKERCDNLKTKHYKNYWGRWITYPGKWKTFEWFWEDMKDWYKDNLSIDRENNNWNYNKSNCRWMTQKKQMRNTRVNLIYKNKCVTEWCEKLWLNRSTIYTRIRKWLSIKEALGL